MTDLAPFPDAIRCLLAVVADLVPDGHTGGVTPPTLATKLPFIRVTSHGGDDDLITDLSRVDVDVFAGTYAQAKNVAELVRQRLITRARVTEAGILDRVRTDTRPHEVPWADDSSIRRFTAAYAASARR